LEQPVEFIYSVDKLKWKVTDEPVKSWRNLSRSYYKATFFP